jgi:uncharacterized protein (TIGR02246 family)
MSPDEQAIRHLVEAWAHATEHGDLAAIEPLMHPDVLFLTAGNEPMGRETFRQRFESMVKSVQIECRPDVCEVQIAGELGYAWTWLQVRVVPRGGGEAIERKGDALAVYRKSAGGEWQLWRDANLVG